MKSLARILVLIKMRTIEIPQAMLIGREMRRHPIENDADPAGMQVVHEIHQILRCAVTRRRREIPRSLISPKTIEGVLGNRHEFNMRKSRLVEILRQGMRQFPVVEKVAVL